MSYFSGADRSVTDASPTEKPQATTRKLRAQDRPLANDCVTDEAFARLLAAWFGKLSRALLPGRAFSLWGGYRNVANYPLP